MIKWNKIPRQTKRSVHIVYGTIDGDHVFSPCISVWYLFATLRACGATNHQRFTRQRDFGLALIELT